MYHFQWMVGSYVVFYCFVSSLITGNIKYNKSELSLSDNLEIFKLNILMDLINFKIIKLINHFK
jgi:hypothetical protein